MAEDMQVKFTKHWEDYSLILAMGAILDPRMKMQILEKAYETVDPTTSASKAKELKSKLKLLYEDYQTRSRASSSRASGTPTLHELVTESPLEDDIDNDLFELERSITVGARNTKTQLDIYLDESRLERKSFPDLDVLSYWRDNQHRLCDLASMARELHI